MCDLTKHLTCNQVSLPYNMFVENDHLQIEKMNHKDGPCFNPIIIS